MRKAGRRAAAKRVRAVRPEEAANKDVYGEGNYTASREFIRDQTDFVRRNKPNIPKMAKDAEAALEGEEGADLRAAEEATRSHAAVDQGEE